ncbi:MAG: N-(5'-phosphoribosyl)anthranilate isomerase [Chromatiales bacterium]|jgi:phosphoribosylanthranilate isomerase|nr:N-(5'-phosphoribosyl)anthranilate isomerase [Chromatiales bacterium]MDP6149763.1 phosphoribosylanthranilate isomerase [Gammaproteobacteria bacterium]MDP7092811.1 phosphoribosylanthranilate isomerase [Gammaproteobacteria bacterium]MDP7270122.1 phosphoribosylanthranilate isomerase [Gammaproteobacteria bacterium]HJP04135.1 phosphoribosylanthranilate isomerase [Gammaproteobacteria bacterium]
MFIKICGINSVEALNAAISSGADAVGFVFAESPREVTSQQAAELTASLPAGIAKVAVMFQPTAEEWNEVRDIFGPDWLQTDAKDFEELDVPDNIGRFPVYRDRVTTEFDKEPADLPEHMLFEGARSGVGLQPDWDHAAQVARRTCLMLAGGLTPDNVTDAIIHVRPWGVDVSSGVESSPGHKDPAKITAFVEAARGAEGVHGV